MKTHENYFSFLVVIIIAFLLIQSHAYASIFGPDDVTFKEYYTESNVLKWVLVTLLVLVGGAVVFFSAGIGAPAVVGASSFIGTSVGFSGVTAIAVGIGLSGAGVVGLEFMEDSFEFDKTIRYPADIELLSNKFIYEKFRKASEGMTTLPIPISESGPDLYEDIVENLKDDIVIDDDTSLSSFKNQAFIKKAIYKISRSKELYSNIDDDIKIKTLQSVLYFSSNDYKKAKDTSRIIIDQAEKYGLKTNLADFIYATSSLYDENPTGYDHFEKSILTEPDNKLIPILYSIYLDRVSARLDNWDEAAYIYEKIAKLTVNPELKEYKVVLLYMLILRYFPAIYLEQQNILSLTEFYENNTENFSEKYKFASKSLVKYEKYIGDTGFVIQAMLKIPENTLEDIEGKNPDFKRPTFYKNLLDKYQADLPNLKTNLHNMKTKIKNKNSQTNTEDSFYSASFIKILIVLFALLIVVFTIKRIRSKP